MKIYYHKNNKEHTNTYLVMNPDSKQAILIDPEHISPKIIEHIENENYSLDAVLITHNHNTGSTGLTTLQKIYNPRIYAADTDLTGDDFIVLKGDGILKAASLNVSYFAVSGHTPDSMAYKVGNCIFTGDSLLAGTIGSTTNPYARKLLITNIQTKIFIHSDEVVIFPGHGPLTTLGSEKRFNMEIGCPMLHTPGVPQSK